MIHRIRELEKLARKLEPDGSVRARLAEQAFDYGDRFLEKNETLPAYLVTEDKGRGLYDGPFTEEGSDFPALLEALNQNVDTPGLNPASGKHLGYIPGGGIYPSALGDYLADVTNRYSGVFFASPGAVRMENMLLRWMAEMVGYPESSAGNLTSGGSIANLIGIVTARDAHGIDSAKTNRAVVYMTDQVHHCLDKALRVAGLGECVRHTVRMDSRFRMDPEDLDTAIQTDLKQNQIPWLVIASAGTTDTGAVDPMEKIAEICTRHKLWFHVDAAYGGFFALCDEGKKILKGMGDSDSLVMDPHKSLFLPYGSGALLVKDPQALLAANHYQANYMQDTLASTDELSPADLSPELTKPFRGLRLWLPLKLLGVAPFRAALEEKMLLARYFHKKIQTLDGFEAGAYPDLSVVTFRYVPKRGDANAFNERLIREIQNDGTIFLSSTLLNGKFTLRVAILVFRTHLETVDLVLDILKNKAADIEKNF